jgi:hypothetical protein
MAASAAAGGSCAEPWREARGNMSSIRLRSCFLRSIMDVQFYFDSHFLFQLENAVGCLGYYK